MPSRSRAGRSTVAVALAGFGLVVVGIVLASVIRHGGAGPPSRPDEAWERASAFAKASADKSARDGGAGRPARPEFADPPSLPAAEPPSDRALVAKTQALADVRPQDAAPALKEIVKETQDPSVLAVAATVATNLPPEDAGEVLSEIVAKGNAPAYAYQKLAQSHAAKGQVQEACAAYEGGLSKHPMEFSLREAYARYLAQHGRTKDAVSLCLDDIEEGKDTRSNSLRRCILAGEILWDAGQKEQARAVWERIIQIAETEHEGRRYVAQILAQHNIAR